MIKRYKFLRFDDRFCKKLKTYSILTKILKARHPGEGRDPVASQPNKINATYVQKRVAFGWIPAFAGMTGLLPNQIIKRT